MCKDLIHLCFYIIEKQEKLQKDFEDEQVRRVVAEKKLEDLESK